MRIICSYQNTKRVHETDADQIVIGRPKGGFQIDLDLSPDNAVSRPHARIWLSEGKYWIEDLGSLRGTRVGGKEIARLGPCRLNVGDVICVGKTDLRFEAIGNRTNVEPARIESAADQAIGETASASNAIEPDSEIVSGLDANVPSAFSATGRASDRVKQLLYEMPLRLAREGSLESLFLSIVERVVDVIPNAVRGAFLAIEPSTGKLLLKAHYPPDEAVISTTMAARAIDSREAFIWQRRVLPQERMPVKIPASVFERHIEAVMFAPLVWQNEVLGVVCVDSGQMPTTFQGEDLQLLLAIAQYAAMAIANHNLQVALKRESALSANLLRQFPPKIAQQLLTSRGRLRLGGERSESTILYTDIRSTTDLVCERDPDEVVEMLNNYFGQLIPVIFANDGAVDKYLGSGILGIFGALEPDPEHHEKAVRAAHAIQGVVRELNISRKKRSQPTCEIRSGIDTGEVIHGFIGTGERMEFTVIGDPVVRATGYSARAADGEIVMTLKVFERVWQLVDAQSTTMLAKHEGDLAAFRLIGLKANRPTMTT